MGRILCVCFTVLVVAGCSSSGPSIPTIGAARTFALSGFTPKRIAPPGTTPLSFTTRQPSGKPLTSYKRGPGPHTGVHLIYVRRDLATIVHRHPPIAADGTIRDSVSFKEPGPYRLVVDVYPNTTGPQRNFQLFGSVRVGGDYRPGKLPP